MTKDEEIAQRSYRFRDEYIAATPSWYRGELHLAFTLIFTGGVLLYSFLQIHHSTLGQWLMVIPFFLFGNWAEWAAHRYLLHRPTRLMKGVYKRHVSVHHQFFTHKTLEYDGQRHWRALLFPPFAPVLFVLSALPAALLVGYFWSANAGYIVMFTMAAYYLMYEGLHTLAHVVDSPLLDRLPLVNTVRRMHVVHHHPELMGTRNFNLTFPICDVLFGTSDLDKGLWATLFNGMSNDAVKPEDLKKMRGRPGAATSSNPAAPLDSTRSS
ncbi:sterol desaturase family protein [Pandoraea sp.]|uniref:sterol desaturase family protein n=1 Tax=Pandoraea sp. TaxID=1883445 RepID=UPI0011F9755B|nr:sterol desaturase family protein [Pandoraea sp.]TAL52195.1 MAG: fatty acid hydroxylase family protein [Pandoraea sp.]TAM19309.1 MAG: fatty acid hydroxylase family protein [Pandoraea sp.]